MTTSDLSVDAALDLVLARASSKRTPSERVGVEQAIGRILAEPVHARWPLPSAPLSVMDGYAVRSRDLIAARDEHDAETLALELVDESAAGHPASGPCEPGTCVRIATGAVIPHGADAVVPQEDTRRIELDQGSSARTLIELSSVALAQVAPGRWIRAIGSDVRDGQALLDPGTPIGGGEASLLAGTGQFEVAVSRRPKVAILTSGDELVPIGQTPGRGQIVATNAMLLAAQIREAGGEPWDLGIIADTHAAMREAIERAAAPGGADLLVSSGGISVGDHDLVLPVLRELGFELGFRKLGLRPGRPTTFGMLGELPVLALPGNPAATLMTFELLVRPLIRAQLGLPRARWARPRRLVELASPAEGDRRREHWIRATLDDHGRAHPLSNQMSGALRSIAGFDAFVRVPAGRMIAAAGERLEAMILRE